MSDVAGRAVLVTGAAGGIGQALVKAFVGAGMRVGVCDLNLAGAEKVAAQYGPDKAIAVEANVADPGACERAVTRVADRFGGLLVHKEQLAKSNEHYRKIHPADAAASDAVLAAETAKAQAKACAAGGR